jgi:hypothetical protein
VQLAPELHASELPDQPTTPGTAEICCAALQPALVAGVAAGPQPARERPDPSATASTAPAITGFLMAQIIGPLNQLRNPDRPADGAQFRARLPESSQMALSRPDGVRSHGRHTMQIGTLIEQKLARHQTG